MLTAATDPDPWCPLPQTVWRNTDLDPKQFRTREQLCQRTALESKLAEAIYFGRNPGLRLQQVERRAHEKLKASVKGPRITTPHW